jgi:hypothetical protein
MRHFAIPRYSVFSRSSHFILYCHFACLHFNLSLIYSFVVQHKTTLLLISTMPIIPPPSCGSDPFFSDDSLLFLIQRGLINIPEAIRDRNTPSFSAWQDHQLFGPFSVYPSRQPYSEEGYRRRLLEMIRAALAIVDNDYSTNDFNGEESTSQDSETGNWLDNVPKHDDNSPKQ